MQHSYLQFQINQLRQVNQTRTLEILVALILTLLFVSLVPSLLMQYVFQDSQVPGGELPAIVTNMPLWATIIGLGYVLFGILGNVIRENKAQRLESELKTMQLMADSSSFSSTDEELAALEKIVDSALEEHSTTTSTKKAAPGKKTRKK